MLDISTGRIPNHRLDYLFGTTEHATSHTQLGSTKSSFTNFYILSCRCCQRIITNNTTVTAVISAKSLPVQAPHTCRYSNHFKFFKSTTPTLARAVSVSCVNVFPHLQHPLRAIKERMHCIPAQRLWIAETMAMAMMLSSLSTTTTIIV